MQPIFIDISHFSRDELANFQLHFFHSCYIKEILTSTFALRGNFSKYFQMANEIFTVSKPENCHGSGFQVQPAEPGTKCQGWLRC